MCGPAKTQNTLDGPQLGQCWRIAAHARTIECSRGGCRAENIPNIRLLRVGQPAWSKKPLVFRLRDQRSHKGVACADRIFQIGNGDRWGGNATVTTKSDSAIAALGEHDKRSCRAVKDSLRRSFHVFIWEQPADILVRQLDHIGIGKHPLQPGQEVCPIMDEGGADIGINRPKDSSVAQFMKQRLPTCRVRAVRQRK